MASAGFEAVCGGIRGACGHLRRLGLLLAPWSPAAPHSARTSPPRCRDPRARRLLSALPRRSSSYLFFFPFLQLRKLLYLWALDPAERDAVVAREAVESGTTVAGYRALIEVFTRRKHDQLFFTKQAYMARFRRNLDQDMVTESSHPYQRARKGGIWMKMKMQIGVK